MEDEIRVRLLDVYKQTKEKNPLFSYRSLAIHSGVPKTCLQTFATGKRKYLSKKNMDLVKTYLERHLINEKKHEQT